VITFRTTDGLVTHRVNSVGDLGLETKGDANRTADAGAVPPQDVVGVVAWGAAYLGYILVFFQQPTGILSLMLLAFSVWCAWIAFFPAAGPTGKHETAAPGDEPPHLSEENSAVIRLPGELAGAAVAGAVIRVPEQRSVSGLF
jgi:signal peptidase